MLCCRLNKFCIQKNKKLRYVVSLFVYKKFQSLSWRKNGVFSSLGVPGQILFLAWMKDSLGLRLAQERRDFTELKKGKTNVDIVLIQDFVCCADI